MDEVLKEEGMMTEAAKRQIAKKYENAMKHADQWKDAFIRAQDDEFKAIACRTFAEYDAEADAVKEVVQILGYKLKKRNGEWVVVPNLAGCKAEAEALSLPEDPMLYGDC